MYFLTCKAFSWRKDWIPSILNNTPGCAFSINALLASVAHSGQNVRGQQTVPSAVRVSDKTFFTHHSEVSQCVSLSQARPSCCKITKPGQDIIASNLGCSKGIKAMPRQLTAHQAPPSSCAGIHAGCTGYGKYTSVLWTRTNHPPWTLNEEIVTWDTEVAAVHHLNKESTERKTPRNPVGDVSWHHCSRTS